MKYLSKNACLLALFALFLGSSLLRAADPELDGDLRKELNSLKKQLEALRQAQEIESKIQETRFKLIDRRLGRIEKSLKRLERSSGEQSSSFKPVTPTTLPIVNTGTLTLTNRLFVPASVTVNGLTYSIPARTTRTLSSVPAGTVTYNVTADGFGIRPTVRTPLGAGEELTLTIY